VNNPRKAAAVAAIGATVLLGLPMAVASSAGAQGKDAPVSGDAQSEYVPSIVDEVLPSKVEEAAREALGGRFVDVRLVNDGQAYEVGVLGLQDGESESLAKLILPAVPIAFQNRTVSAEEVRALADQLSETLAKDRRGVDLIAPDLNTGSVVLGVGSEEQLEAATSFATNFLSDHFGTAKVEDPTSRAFPDAEVVVSTGQANVPTVALFVSRETESEGPYEAPYRAGKYVRVGSSNANCTTSFFVGMNQKNWGMTAGHCGNNGSNVHFGGDQKGDIQWNQLFGHANPKADVALFDLNNGGTATMYRSSTLNRDVTGQYSNNELVDGLRVCSRGAFTGDQSCGDIYLEDADTWSSTVEKYVANGWCYTWDPYGNVLGDSGAPVYRVKPNESINAAGVLRSIGINHSCMTSIGASLNQLGGANLKTTN
jgi:hypothetical protein